MYHYDLESKDITFYSSIIDFVIKEKHPDVENVIICSGCQIKNPNILKGIKQVIFRHYNDIGKDFSIEKLDIDENTVVNVNIDRNRYPKYLINLNRIHKLDMYYLGFDRENIKVFTEDYSGIVDELNIYDNEMNIFFDTIINKNMSIGKFYYKIKEVLIGTTYDKFTTRFNKMIQHHKNLNVKEYKSQITKETIQMSSNQFTEIEHVVIVYKN